jgi:hypothetical protein
VGSKGSDTKTTAPNPTAMAAYQDILSRAQGVSGTPYTPYTGQLVAPVNTQQNLGISNINQNAGFAFPYIQQAAGYANDAAQPLTHDQIQYYTDPYTQRVIQATQAQFANQNEQQRQGVIGNAISKGALGGNREAIAEAELANQQQLAQAPVIAGLQSQGYTTGLNTALTEQQARAQGAYSLGNLGVSGQNAALTGANAQVGAGTLEQGTQQAQDAALYQQFINQQAYPFQTTQWLAGIGSGIGSQMGSTTTGPSPSLMGQLLGFGTAGLGAAGKAGLFSGATAGGTAAAGAGAGEAASVAALAPEAAAALFLASGGAVRRASGGVAPAEQITLPETPETLKLQQRQLLSGHRRVQMFPRGTPELPLPRGMSRINHPNGTFHYDPRRIDGSDVHRLSTEGRENDMLDLGPYSKDDVLKRLRGGEVPVAVVERHPDGTEVRAAIGTHTTADRQMAAMNRTKSPGHIVRTEDPRETLGHRLRAFGGRVPGFADGGMAEAPPTNGVGAVLGGTPYGSGSGWIPRMDIARGAPHASEGVAPPQSLAQQAKEIGSLANLINNPHNGSAPSNSGGHAEAALMPDDPEMYGGGMVRASGGVANLPFHHMVPHLADGGSPYDTDYFDNTFGAPIRRTNDVYEIASDPDRMSAYRDRASDDALAAHPEYTPLPQSRPTLPQRRPEGIAPSYDDLPPEITAGTSRPARERAPEMSFAESGGDRGGGEGGGGQSRGVAPPSGINFGSDSKLWPSLMTAGLGMLASKSPFAGVAIGEGGLAGMQAYSNERTREDRINSEAKKLAQEAEFAQKRLDQATRPYTEQTADQKAKSEEAARYHDILSNRMQLRPTGSMVETPDGPHPVFIDSRSGASIDGITGEPLAPDAKIVQGGGKPGATQILARELMKDREEQRKADPSVPALSFEEAVNLAHRAPNADQGTVRRLNLAQSAWKSWTSNPQNMGKKDAPENNLEFWEKRYNVRGAPSPAASTVPPATTLRPIDQQALDWANANPSDPRAAEIKRRLGVK